MTTTTIADRRITDAGLEAGIARLTPDGIQKTINEVLAGEGGARLKTYVESCVRCGMCAKGCHYYVSHQDPSYAPVAKVRQTMWEILKHKGRVSPEFIHQCAQIAFTECNLCKRCMHYCPLGIDTGYIMAFVRRICHRLGVVPQYLQDTANSHSATMNQMWIKDDEWIDSLKWQEDEARDEIPTIRIPLEVEGADFMYSVIGPEPKFRTQLIYQAAVIFNEAGLNWTMPATPGWDNSNMAMYSGDLEIMGRVELAHFETAQRLRVKRIVMGECGHAFRAVYDMGNRWLGWHMHPMPVVHSIEFFWELLNSGKIQMAKKYPGPVTIHDPCNVIRGRGLMDKLREVAAAITEEVVEMHPNREHNFCCCAGGGVINCGPPFKNVRTSGNAIKAKQIRDTGVKTCIAPCHNCHGGLEDIIHKYELGVELKFLGDIIYECMEKKSAS
ncbi:electron transfer complex ferredoxin TmcB [Desulfolutivibrio sulfoxidireducens]|uniref:electron transfer complex ferredoxin TmcB n=1 Tax=Desulfolutivibrio sulfoxidireducens TaxID=2773299 RepID=UPI00159E1874|nr:(Fe-S)-binding protein [Desulfolutivibrio sulfoxidireducens]QLA15469.1 (Fe-S)-binding protein [Desulfolutivibrio sulfoxidireducens]QLA19068.1 (Fe-S)-binding protein [Desulfolutivibrio sulfoxidireducens]